MKLNRNLTKFHVSKTFCILAAWSTKKQTNKPSLSLLIYICTYFCIKIVFHYSSVILQVFHFNLKKENCELSRNIRKPGVVNFYRLYSPVALFYSAALRHLKNSEHTYIHRITPPDESIRKFRTKNGEKWLCQ